MLHLHSSFFKTNLANLRNLGKDSKFWFETFQNKIEFEHLNFDTLKGFLILTKFGKFAKFISSD